MRRLSSTKVWILLVVVLLLSTIPPIYVLAAHASTEEQCGKGTDLVGTVDSLSAKRGVVRLYDPANKSADPEIGRVNMMVTVNATTRIFRQQGDACLHASFTDLKPGQRLKIWSRNEDIIEIYPLRIQASEIVIED